MPSQLTTVLSVVVNHRRINKSRSISRNSISSTSSGSLWHHHGQECKEDDDEEEEEEDDNSILVLLNLVYNSLGDKSVKVCNKKDG